MYREYRTFQEFLDEFFPDEPETWQRIKEESERLAAQEAAFAKEGEGA